MVTERIELLGKGLYDKIPDVLTLRSIPTTSELEYVGADEFDKTMLESVFPVAIAEFESKELNPYDLLELDYRWICRCLRILNYGPFYTTNALFCEDCGKTSHGEYQVNLNTVNCVQFPEGFVNDLTITKDEFIDFDEDVTLKLPTIKEILSAYKDSTFAMKNGDINLELARMCYMIKSIGTSVNLNPVETKVLIQSQFSPADYMLLKDAINKVTDYGLRAGGSTICPKCGSPKGGFIAISDERFFRPTVGDLKMWKQDKHKRVEASKAGK